MGDKTKKTTNKQKSRTDSPCKGEKKKYIQRMEVVIDSLALIGSDHNIITI